MALTSLAEFRGDVGDLFTVQRGVDSSVGRDSLVDLERQRAT